MRTPCVLVVSLLSLASLQCEYKTRHPGVYPSFALQLSNLVVTGYCGGSSQARDLLPNIWCLLQLARTGYLDLTIRRTKVKLLFFVVIYVIWLCSVCRLHVYEGGCPRIASLSFAKTIMACYRQLFSNVASGRPSMHYPWSIHRFTYYLTPFDVIFFLFKSVLHSYLQIVFTNCTYRYKRNKIWCTQTLLMKSTSLTSRLFQGVESYGQMKNLSQIWNV